jgi:hypothetical protein
MRWTRKFLLVSYHSRTHSLQKLFLVVEKKIMIVSTKISWADYQSVFYFTFFACWMWCGICTKKKLWVPTCRRFKKCRPMLFSLMKMISVRQGMDRIRERNNKVIIIF